MIPTPSRVQSSAGTAVTTGTATLSLTNCTAGNIVIFHVASRGVTDDYDLTTDTNIDDMAGNTNATDTIVSGSGIGPGILHKAEIARVHSNGTVSVLMVVGASGEDLFGQVHEFRDVSRSKTAVGTNGVFENGSNALGRDVIAGHSTTPNFGFSPIVSNGPNRLGVTLTAIASNQSMSNWTSETGGYDLTEETEFQSATGATCTLQMQTGVMANAGTCDNGTQTIGVATDWVICTFALNGEPDIRLRSPQLDYDYSR